MQHRKRKVALKGSYVVPESEWERLGEVRGGLGALMDLADGPKRIIKLDSDRLIALVGICDSQLGEVMDAAKFSTGA